MFNEGVPSGTTVVIPKYYQVPFTYRFLTTVKDVLVSS